MVVEKYIYPKCFLSLTTSKLQKFHTLSRPHDHHHSINLNQTTQLHSHFLKTLNSTHEIRFPFLKPQLSSTAKFNFLITSYVKNQHPEVGILLYAYMRKNGIKIDTFTIPSILKACVFYQDCSFELGREIHGFVVKNGLDCDIFVVNALVFWYGECRSIVCAKQVFDEMHERDGVSWSTMIRGYIRSGLVAKGLEFVGHMQLMNVRPSEVAMISMVSLFSELGDAEMARAMHGYVIRNCAGERMGVTITTSLIDMHAKCGNLVLARRVFDGLALKNVVSWTAMVAGYIRCGKLKEGAESFNRMLEEGIFPSEITLLSLIIECGFAEAQQLGQQLHGYIARHGFDINLSIYTALIDMYGKCNKVEHARALFEFIENPNISMWNAIISAYTQSASINEAARCFVQLKASGIRPNEATILSLLTSCAETGFLNLGRWYHSYLEKHGMKDDIMLRTTLVDMYCKCGDMDSACRLFSEAADQDMCMWNALIAGYGKNGCANEALKLYLTMKQFGIKPNDTTFVALLHACSHAGFVAEGKKLFKEMVYNVGLAPKVEHYGCMVDLLGRAGLLDEALGLIKTMPMRPNIIVLGAFLAASQLHRNSDLENITSKMLSEIEPVYSSYNVLMSNIYASENRWRDVEDIRKGTTNLKNIKAGLSMIETCGFVLES